MSPAKTIKRSDLYQRVWQQPMSHLAKTFDLSDVGLAKICRKHDIPRPPRGYWAKKQFGKQPPQIPLPESERDDEIQMRDPDSVPVEVVAQRTEMAQAVADEQQKGSRIVVAESLRGSHPLVSQANQEFQTTHKDHYGFVVGRAQAGLDIRVSKGSLRRALLIMDAILKALEQRDYQVESGPTVKILGAKIQFGITEQLEIQRDPDQEHNLDGNYTFGHSRFAETRVPSGRLTLKISDVGAYWLHGTRLTWRDTEKTKLEDRLDQFVAGLVAAAVRTQQHVEEERRREEQRRQEELSRQEVARQRAELRQRQKVEQARVDELLKQAENWRNSKLVRELVEAVREAHSAAGAIDPHSEIAGWIEWAIEQADRLDPLRPSPPSILDEVIPDDEPAQRGFSHRW